MRLAIIFLPALVIANVLRVQVVEMKSTLGPDDPPDDPPKYGNCCNRTPCFIGYPVGGSFKVSFRFNDQTERRAIERAQTQLTILALLLMQMCQALIGEGGRGWREEENWRCWV